MERARARAAAGGVQPEPERGVGDPLGVDRNVNDGFCPHSSAVSRGWPGLRAEWVEPGGLHRCVVREGPR